MPLLVDGHNLIGHDPDISLADPQDELLLIRKLESYSRSQRRSLVVYFDRGGRESGLSPAAGLVTVRFVRPPRTADDAILAHLRRLGGEARNWTVVTSDRQLQAAAKELGAGVVRSDEFLSALRTAEPAPADAEKPEVISEEEIKEWQELFRRGPENGQDQPKP